MTSSGFDDPNLQAILEKVAREECFKQPKFTVSQGCKPGDNFIGRVYRAVITETDNTNVKKTLSLIFKASPISKHRQEMLSSDQVFLTESEVYEVILPTLNKLLNKSGVVKSSTFPGTARCFAVQLNDGTDPEMAHVLVLEDKSADGFQMVDRKISLDAEHCRKILQKLALWHSASLALNHLEPETAGHLQKIVSKDIWFSNKDHPLLKDLKRGAVNSLDILQEPYKKGNPVYDRLAEMVYNYENEFVNCNEHVPDLCCINHGDCWSNNILFQYNKDGALQDVCLIDLQLSRVASPAVDIVYMIFLCTTKEVRDACYDDLIRYYYSELTSNLKKIGCDPEKIVPWKLLQEHFKRFGRMGVLIAMTALPVFMADSSDIKLDLHAADHEGSVFAECANVTDPKTKEEISRRITDAVIDGERLGYI